MRFNTGTSLPFKTPANAARPMARRPWLSMPSDWWASGKRRRSPWKSKCRASNPGRRGSSSPAAAACSNKIVRHSHQAMKPENFKPRMLTTPVRRPIAASYPRVEKRKGLFFAPAMTAAMLSPRTRPWRRACCAVGGWNPPLRSGTSAQSPRAHTPGSALDFEVVVNHRGRRDWVLAAPRPAGCRYYRRSTPVCRPESPGRRST